MSEQKMQVVEISVPGGPEVLRLSERPIPIPSQGQVLIKVIAAGVNRPDVLQRMGKYAPPAGASELPGLELAGEIIAGDLSGSHFAIGDLVCVLVAGGAYAQYCVAETALCLPIPQGWSPVQAASLPETYMTVWSNVFQRGRLAQGESLLVHGGSSGIGVAAIQLAAARGHQVYVTCGNEEKCRACEELGAVRAINYRQDDFVQVIKEATMGRGVDLVLDMVAGEYLSRNLNSLADDGRLVLIALQGGVRSELDMGQILRRRLSVTGSTLRPRSNAFKADLAASLEKEVWPLIAEGKIKPVIYRSFPMAQAAQAHALMESNQHIGKIMLEMP
nr:Quinone oxidoreductase [uncultured bacterium]